ncbi:hypothetical protein GCK72_015719 [Caenorhabditis remanei]|uniref:RING-type domain-containing protein n=1 Tax=Caenorhabditis remanei TaxID=31234 RepID=A0A6A5GXK3_CAERE|nr:hypothetical protein GCK72_015719 [Caenorhabditis remanei]KAF1759255.1 hypothetical protein GCK72_015719 [Caenorhabditis remanei]
MDHTGKFMMSHTFHNVEHSNKGDPFKGPRETINGLECQIRCYKKDESEWMCWLSMYNLLPPSLGWKTEYKIRTKNGVETVGTREGRIGGNSWIMFRKDPKNIVDGNLTIECHVEVYEIDKNGVSKPRAATENKTKIEIVTPRLFDESMKEFSDVVLIVEDKKFYFLASESSYFKSLFIGSFEESKKDEISLKDVEAKYFQLFLESLYGDPVINDETVDGILKLADMFDAKRVVQKCQFHLINKSKKSLKEKLDLAVKFNSNELKEFCLKQIKSVDDVRSVMSKNTKEMDPDVLAFLLEKSLSLRPCQFAKLLSNSGPPEQYKAKEQQKAKEEHKKKDTLSCTICLLEYGEEGDRTPRVLDCGHTLCLGCCKQIVQPNQIQCPFCRVDTQLTGRTVSNLPKNYLALSLSTQLISLSSLTMEYTGKFIYSHTFLDIEHSTPGEYHAGPFEKINEIAGNIWCHKEGLSEWECRFCIYKNPSPSLGRKIEYKIRTKNGFETIGTTDGRIKDVSSIRFLDDSKYFVDGHMTIECHVEVYEIDENGVRIPPTVIEKETARLFDESMKEFSDVVLIVEDKTFYVNKLYLASESSYFKSLFIGSFVESKKDEISLKDVEAKYFQLFLESLYGDPVINDETLDGILKLADMFDAQRVILKCEFHLIKNSKKSLKEKLDLAVKFNSSVLKETCLEQIKTVEDIRGVMSKNTKEMDPDVLAFLLEKSLSLRN